MFQSVHSAISAIFAQKMSKQMLRHPHDSEFLIIQIQTWDLQKVASSKIRDEQNFDNTMS